jgi:ATP-dependent Clp protease ATP-binding subunit ClpA
MNIEKYTTKAAEAIQSAQHLVIAKKHASIDEPHLLLAMIEQTD